MGSAWGWLCTPRRTGGGSSSTPRSTRPSRGRVSPESWSRQALDATREEGLRIVAVCPYVSAYVKRHHDWDDVLDRVDREALDAVRQADS